MVGADAHRRPGSEVTCCEITYRPGRLTLAVRFHTGSAWRHKRGRVIDVATLQPPIPTGKPDRRVNTRALVGFFVLAFAISWAWALPFALGGQVVERGDGWPTHYPALLGPAVAAVIVIAVTTGVSGLRDLGSRMLRWRVRLRWWLVALSPAGFLALAWVVLWVFGSDLPEVADFGRFTGTPTWGLLGVLLMITLVGSLGEEVGWRGYALPELQRRFTPLSATLLLALLWFSWHIPQFFIIESYREFGPVEYVGMFIGLTCGAVILTWLYNRSGGSLLLVIVWHGVYNFVGATEAAVGALAATITTLVIIHGVTLVIAELLARHRGHRSILSMPSTTTRATL
jgi:membrane protease YdiL (CAAX protease family)